MAIDLQTVLQPIQSQEVIIHQDQYLSNTSVDVQQYLKSYLLMGRMLTFKKTKQGKS